MGKKNLIFMGFGLLAGILMTLVVYHWWRTPVTPSEGPAGIAAARIEKGKAHSEEEEGKSHSEERVVKLSEGERREFNIEVRSAGPGKLIDQLNLPGEIVLNPDRVGHIVPRVAGVIRSVFKSVGDPVQAGDLMAILESRELADSKAAYLAALKRIELAEATLRREEMLWRKRISPEQDYLEARNALAEARITLNSASQKLRAIGFSEEYLAQLPLQQDAAYTNYEIRAPFGGMVIERHLTPGEFHKDDHTAFTIADLSTVWVKISVYQKDLPIVRKGQRVHIFSGRGIPDTEGLIAYIEPGLKEQTRTAVAVVSLSNPQGLFRPGLFVTCKIEAGEFPIGLSVPKTALVQGENQILVFLETTHGFEPQPVVLGRSDEANTEILSGIKPGQLYVAKGGFTLQAQLSRRGFGDGHAH
jgi:membrane fusion protein, heavy metal efflux system